MKFMVTGDFQLQKGLRFGDAVNALKLISDYVINNGIKYVFILGDVYERNDIIAGSEEEIVFINFIKSMSCVDTKIKILLGNHDIIDGHNNVMNSIKLLVDDNVEIITHPSYSSDFPAVYIPYIHRSVLVESGKSYRDYFIDVAAALYKKLGGPNILFTHCDILGATPEKGVLPRSDVPSADDIAGIGGVEICFSGHIHKHQSFHGKRVRPEVVYCGAPIHTTFSSGNDPKGFVIGDWVGHGKCTWEFMQMPSRKQLEITMQDNILNTDIYGIDVKDAMVKLRVIYNRNEYNSDTVKGVTDDLYNRGAFYVKIVPIQMSVNQLQEINVVEYTDKAILQQYLLDVKNMDYDYVNRILDISRKYMGE